MMEEAKQEKLPAARITPLEIEEGLAVPSTEVPVASTKPVQQQQQQRTKTKTKSTCQRYVWIIACHDHPLPKAHSRHGRVYVCTRRPLKLPRPILTPTYLPTTTIPRHRHRGKFICLGVTLTLLGAAGIAAAILWPKMPVFTLYSESVLSIDLLGTNTAKLMVQIENPNRFASA